MSDAEFIEVTFSDPLTGDEIPLRYRPNLDSTFETYAAANEAYAEGSDATAAEMGMLKELVAEVDGYERLEQLPTRWVLPFAGASMMRMRLGPNYGAIMGARLEAALRKAKPEAATSTSSTAA